MALLDEGIVSQRGLCWSSQGFYEISWNKYVTILTCCKNSEHPSKYCGDFFPMVGHIVVISAHYQLPLFWRFFSFIHSFIHSFIPLACAECDDSLLFSGASSIPLCYISCPSTLFHQLVFHPPPLHLAICFLVYFSTSLFPNSYIILFWEFYFLPFSVHGQITKIYLTLALQVEGFTKG